MRPKAVPLSCDSDCSAGRRRVGEKGGGPMLVQGRNRMMNEARQANVYHTLFGTNTKPAQTNKTERATD